MTIKLETEIAIIGSGMGGGIISRALAEKGHKVLILERGSRLPREDRNWDPSYVFIEGAYKNASTWLDENGKEFAPGVHYYVGGNTKVYGASLFRFREKDFEEYQAAEGVSPAWPFKYADLEPYYSKAEKWLKVHGNVGEDPTEPWRSEPYPFPAVPHEAYLKKIAEQMERLGLKPLHMAMGVDRQTNGLCIQCKTCDGFPCKLGAKSDAETCGVDPAIATGNATLIEGIEIYKLEHDETGKTITSAKARKNGEEYEIHAKIFILSGGAANSAALLLKSKSSKYPHGLANSSGLVGKNWMVHNATFMVGFDPRRGNDTNFQKTLSVNDWYWESPQGYPLGNIQMLGKLQAAMFKASRPWAPTWALKYLANHSIDLYIESEDLPSMENHISVDADGRIRITWKPNNMKAHKGLVKQATRMLRKLGFPVVLTEQMGIETNSHMCGTVVAGNDPKTSVLNQFCRTHDLSNLYVVDSSFFPSSAAVNPALTIAAQALRVADLGGISS
jgi:choline dehydrogenase-like flavoprotein